MSDSVVSHPYHELMAEAQREREVVDSPEAQALLDTIFEAVGAYSDFLERHGLIRDDYPDYPRLKARALVATVDYGKAGEMDVPLKVGALDRVYGNATNPDPFGQGPSDIPHKQRNDD
jgi:hypothetical protein